MAHVTGPLSISDGLATPVSRSFEPRKLDAAASTFVYKRATTDSREKWVSLGVLWSDSTVKRPTVRQEVSIEFPVLRDVAGVSTVVAIGRAVVTFVVPDVMTEDEVKDMRAFTLNGTSNASISLGTIKREPIFG